MVIFLCIPAFCPSEQSRASQVRANETGADAPFSGGSDFEAERFVEEDDGGFGGAVIGQFDETTVTGHAGDGDDVAVILVQHGRQKGLDRL